MLVGQHSLKAVREKRGALETSGADLGQRVVVVDHSQIQLAVLQPRGQSMQMVVHHRQPNIWVQAAEPREGRGHERAQYAREAAKPQPTTTSFGDLGEFLLCGCEPSQDPIRVPGQRGTGFGELDRASASPHHRQPDLAFQEGDVLADRRLRDTQGIGGRRESTFRGESGQDVKAPNVQHKHNL